MGAGDPDTPDEIYEESAWHRCWVATKVRCLSFQAAAAAVVLGGLGAAVSVFISSNSGSVTEQAILAFGAAAGGSLAVFVALLIFSAVRAPFEQRDELR